jgi:hypothetical protein
MSIYFLSHSIIAITIKQALAGTDIIVAITLNKKLIKCIIIRNFKSVQHYIKLIRYDGQYFNLNFCNRRTNLIPISYDAIKKAPYTNRCKQLKAAYPRCIYYKLISCNMSKHYFIIP